MEALRDLFVQQKLSDPNDITLLINEQATRASVLQILDYLMNEDNVGSNDRVVIFFAGHAFVGNSDDPSTAHLIPYDEKYQPDGKPIPSDVRGSYISQ